MHAFVHEQHQKWVPDAMRSAPLMLAFCLERASSGDEMGSRRRGLVRASVCH
jgi:hypothetical protein